MSAPDAEREKQERRHKPGLMGFKGALVFVALALIGFVFYAAVQRAETSFGGTTTMPLAPADAANAGSGSVAGTGTVN